jgi:hypothetical protein
MTLVGRHSFEASHHWNQAIGMRIQHLACRPSLSARVLPQMLFASDRQAGDSERKTSSLCNRLTFDAD